MKKSALKRTKQNASQQTPPAAPVQTKPEAKQATELQKISPTDPKRSEGIAEDQQALCKLTAVNGTEVVQKTDRAEIVASINKALCQITGVRSTEVANQIVSQMGAMQVWGADSPNSAKLATSFGMMAELKPANATEALLAVQMFGVHEAALVFLKRATVEGQTVEGCDANVLRATRLMRLFKEQLEAMARLKGKTGQQKVTVEHVHVHSGGQAVVGVVEGTARKVGHGCARAR